jgi:uncharacterized protein YndB with AHSA1/START domain
VPGAELVFEHEIDLPANVVWDALVDPVLLEGWLAAADSAPELERTVRLEWRDGSEPAGVAATVERFEPFRALHLSTDTRGSIGFLLTERPGGLRGMGTVLELRIELDVDAQFTALAREDWEAALERLDDVLSGRPADWAAVSRLRSASLAHMSRNDNIR